MTINDAFEYILSTWDALPKHVKNAYYIYKYRHINKIQLIGASKKIELIQAAGYKIEVFKDENILKDALVTENDVLKDIIFNELPFKFEVKYGRYVSLLIYDINNEKVSPHVRKAMIEAAGYTRVFVKNKSL